MKIIKINGFKVINLTDGSKIKNAVKLINKNKAGGINFNYIKIFLIILNL